MWTWHDKYQVIKPLLRSRDGMPLNNIAVGFRIIFLVSYMLADECAEISDTRPTVFQERERINYRYCSRRDGIHCIVGVFTAPIPGGSGMIQTGFQSKPCRWFIDLTNSSNLCLEWIRIHILLDKIEGCVTFSFRLKSTWTLFSRYCTDVSNNLKMVIELQTRVKDLC